MTIDDTHGFSTLLNSLDGTTGYCQLPAGLAARAGVLREQKRQDVFGNATRWDVTKYYMRREGIRSCIDLGGHSGFFSLSALESNVADSAKVYDLNPAALKAGQRIADSIGILDRIEFIEKSISIDSVNEIPNADCVFCLNLLHHAGSLFDIDIVKREGWGWYAKAWMQALRRKARFAVIGLGFKGYGKPAYWDVNHHQRPKAFRKIADSCDWNIDYCGNIADIELVGMRFSNHIREKVTVNRLCDALHKRLRSFQSIPRKTHKYYLYVLSTR